MRTLGARIPEAGLHPLDYQAALKLRNCAKNRENHLASRRASVKRLAQANKCYSESAESFQRAEQMRNGPREAIELPDGNNVESAPVRIRHQGVKMWPLRFRPGNPDVHVLAGEGPTSALAIFAQFANLHFRRLSIADR